LSDAGDASYALRDRFLELGKKNLTLIVYPDADHTLKTKERSLRHDFFRKMDSWLRQS
jgi:alpha-beta hydrolase superfamily lysophospholipase